VIEDAVTVTEALDVLLDVEPPYPPLGLQDDPAEAGISLALGVPRRADRNRHQRPRAHPLRRRRPPAPALLWGVERGRTR